MGYIKSLDDTVSELISVSRELGKYNEMLLHYNDMNDKRNFNPEKCNKILLKIRDLDGRYMFLHSLLFD